MDSISSITVGVLSVMMMVLQLILPSIIYHFDQIQSSLFSTPTPPSLVVLDKGIYLKSDFTIHCVIHIRNGQLCNCATMTILLYNCQYHVCV